MRRGVDVYLQSPYITCTFQELRKEAFLKPIEMRYASYYILLERMIELQEPLQLMVMTQEWNRWPESRTEQEKRVKKTVKSDQFWSDAKYIVSIITMVFQVIKYGDADSPNLGEVYECIDSMLG